MASRWFSTVVYAKDHPRLARWWAEVLDYRVVYENPDLTLIADRSFPTVVKSDGVRFLDGALTQPGLLFMRMAMDKTGKNRLHIDISPDDQDSEVERLLDMGARHIEPGARRVAWVTLADPEGNEFCVMNPIEQL